MSAGYEVAVFNALMNLVEKEKEFLNALQEGVDNIDLVACGGK